MLTKGIAKRKKFEGRCVNIIVDIGPIFWTNFEDNIPLIPPTMLQQNNNIPTEANEMLYLSAKKNERNDFAINAPPKASNANKILMITIVLKFLGSIPARLRTTFYYVIFASIDFELSIDQYVITFRNPNNAYK